METIVRKVNYNSPNDDINVIREAAKIIKRGGLVAFPTETVYGLGANALDEAAVSAIYGAKGRPGDNPLIVHIYSEQQLDSIVKEVTPVAKALMEKFWPGPMTIVLKKSHIIPDRTSGGLDTVAVRIPENETARLLIKEAGLPIAAPSANTSGKPSPTSADHVVLDLLGRIDMIVDGGHCQFGLESTVVDATGDCPVILRPGSITDDMIKDVCGSVMIDPAVLAKPLEGIAPKAPGQKYRHYSPSARLTLFAGNKQDVVIKINELADNAKGLKKIGIMCADDTMPLYKSDVVLSLGDRDNPAEIGVNLFKILRQFDAMGVERIYGEAFPNASDWLAVNNRLEKAAAYDIVFINE